MKIINSIMPISDIEALAADGQKLRVAVTKTSAQGKAAQSAAPNLMSFSTDENNVWFNGKKYGVHVFKSLQRLSTSSSSDDVKKALNIGSPQDLESLISKGLNFVSVDTESTDKNLCPCSVRYTAPNIISITYCSAHSSNILTVHISAPSGSSSSFRVDNIEDPISSIPSVNNTLTSTSASEALSAAMGKKLQDEKLSKTDVVNNLTTISASKALSAAQGKALNDRISGLGNVYRVKGTKTNLSDVLALTNAEVGDVWNVTNAFTLGGKPYPANTNVVCITATSSSAHDEGNWDPLGGTVNLSTYVPKSDIVDNLLTSDSKKPLSAKQGLALAAMITELEDDKETYQLLKTFESGTLSTQSEIDAILGPYSSFNAALNAGKVIHGVYKDGANRMNTVAFSAFNDTTNSRVRMFAVLNNSTLLYIQATYSGTNWTSATTSEEPFSAGTTIE
jgi:hypothetical protein